MVSSDRQEHESFGGQPRADGIAGTNNWHCFLRAQLSSFQDLSPSGSRGGAGCTFPSAPGYSRLVSPYGDAEPCTARLGYEGLGVNAAGMER